MLLAVSKTPRGGMLMPLIDTALRPPAAESLAAAGRVLAALFEGGVMAARVELAPPEGAQRRYGAAVTARRAANGAVLAEARPRRLVIHPARTFGCSGRGPVADPQLPLPVLDRLWVLALRNWLDGLPAGIPGQRLPADALAWLAAHPAVLPPSCTLTVADVAALLGREGVLGRPVAGPSS